MLVLDDVSYAITDWSIDGFRALGFRGGYNAGDPARVRLIVVHRGRPIGFDAKARILRVDPLKQEIAGQFSSMSEKGRKELARVSREKLALDQESGKSLQEVDQRAISRALQSRGLE